VFIKLVLDQIRQNISNVLVSTGKPSSGGVVSSFENFRKHSQIWKIPIVVALFDFVIEKGSAVSLL
jgi:hypothetical protein